MLSLSFGFACRGAGASPASPVCWTAVSRHRKKCLGTAGFAFAEDFPILSTLTAHVNCNTPGISVGRGGTGGWMLGSIITHPSLSALTICLMKSTEMLHDQHQSQRRGLMGLVINGARKTHPGVQRSSPEELASAKISSIQELFNPVCQHYSALEVYTSN